MTGDERRWEVFWGLFVEFHDSPSGGPLVSLGEHRERESIEGAAVGDYLAAFSGHEIKE